MDPSAADVQGILDKHRGTRGEILAVLQEIQERHGYLPESLLREISEKSGRPLVDLYAMATFYRAFSLEPRGRHTVSVCLGTACHVRGAPGVAEEFERRLKIRAGQTSADGEFTLETVNCLGACALGPIVVADGRYHSRVKPAQAGSILQKARNASSGGGDDVDSRAFPVDVSCPRCGHDLMDPAHPIEGRPSVGLNISSGGRLGWLRLSSFYGSPRFEVEFDVSDGSVTEFFCPHCLRELTGGEGCVECGAPMVTLDVCGGAVGRFCSRRACRGHRLDLGEGNP